jgi:hypothetical protein
MRCVASTLGVQDKRMTRRRPRLRAGDDAGSEVVSSGAFGSQVAARDQPDLDRVDRVVVRHRATPPGPCQIVDSAGWPASGASILRSSIAG